MLNILKNNLKSYLHNWKTIVFRADIHLIWGCNFKCIMCDNWKNEVEMYFKYDDLIKYILILKNIYNCNYVRFHGQEPTMYNRLEDLILFSKNIWLRVAIKTNWWLISNTRLIKILKGWLDELYLSIDWPNKEIHDEIRWVKWSFDKNIDIIIKAKKINPNLKIYINSVVMMSNYIYLKDMVELWFKYKLNRVSFVFLNDKNRKDINNLNLDKEKFINYFENDILEIYKKSDLYNIPVDFSPFISNFVWKDNYFIINELKNNFYSYKNEILNFYNWEYWKTFYDNYWCKWPLDHCSINFNWDMFWCCVVERDKNNAVWNVIKDDLFWLWNTKKYQLYRENSDSNCSYSKKCASNFYTRKNLFKSIYLDDNLFSLDTPLNYYRYLKELNNESAEVLNSIKLIKLRNILLHFYCNLPFYKELLLQNNIKEEDLQNINSLHFIEKLPILDKKILKDNIDEIFNLSKWKEYLKWKTSWNSWDSLDFRYPLDFKRYIKQIVWFSLWGNFTYNYTYFSVTPLNCNQIIINNIIEPDYVRKIYINIYSFKYSKELFEWIKEIFDNNKNVKTLHWDSKYLLFIIQWFIKYWIKLPNLNLISISYSYTNKSLKEFIKKSFWCKIIDNYWCSEVWPISFDNLWVKNVYWDNIFIEENNNEIIVSDLDNVFFPFIRYKNWDLWSIKDNIIELYWKKSQNLNWLNLKDIDDYFYNNFPDILFYQFEDDKVNIIWWKYEIKILELSISNFIWKEIKVVILDSQFFKLGKCSKFKIIN